jgi:hypothetical protein
MRKDLDMHRPIAAPSAACTRGATNHGGLRAPGPDRDLGRGDGSPAPRDPSFVPAEITCGLGT